MSNSLYNQDQDTYVLYLSIVRYTGSTATFDRSIATIATNIPSTCVPIEIQSTATSIIATHAKIRNNVTPSIPIQISNMNDAINANNNNANTSSQTPSKKDTNNSTMTLSPTTNTTSTSTGNNMMMIDESTISPRCQQRRFAVLRFLCELESLLFVKDHI